MTAPAFLTFTGVDAATDLTRARDLSEKYPIEWGVLFSSTRTGSGRYPALDVVVKVAGALPRLSAHLCGSFARGVVSGWGCPPLGSILRLGFDRVQVNTSDPSVDPGVVATFARSVDPGMVGILQTRGDFPDDPRVNWLFDRSGGRGELPTQLWPELGDGPGLRGYAGGLGPATIKDALAAIRLATFASSAPYYLDMESNVRTDDRLDLDKVEAVCEAVYGRAGVPTPGEPRSRSTTFP